MPGYMPSLTTTKTIHSFTLAEASAITYADELLATIDHTYTGWMINASAGEDVVFPNLCYLKNDGKFWKTDADAAATTEGLLAIAVAIIASGRYEYYNTGFNFTVDFYGANQVAQTFTPSFAHTITSVKLLIWRVGLPGTITVSIRETDGEGHPTGADLCSGTTDGNTLIDNLPGEWREIALGAGYNLDANTKYAIVVRALTGDGANRVIWRCNITSPTYVGGNYEFSDNSGTSWNGTVGADLMFEEWGVAIPLPTGFLLRGFIRDDSWTWTVGGIIYVSTTTGELTQTAPAGPGDQVRKVGVAISADVIWFNPDATVDTTVTGGGLYGINVETLGADKTLTPGTDEMYQYLDEGGADRIITLATAGASAGDRFIIRHNGAGADTHSLEVKQGVTSLDKIYAGNVKEFIFDGTNWIAGETGTGESLVIRLNTAIGFQANAYDRGTAFGNRAVAYSYGIAVGEDCDGHSSGVAIGVSSSAHTYGIAIGRGAVGYSYGVAIGYSAMTNAEKYSIALGYKSETERTGETSININGDDSDQENNVVQGRWEGQLAGGAGATEIFCAGQANERFTIRPNSVLAFEMVIVARDNVANEVARYSVHDGLIKRDGADNTAIVLCTVTVDHEDDAGWDCAVTADDGNEALIITVTGDAANPTQWAAVMNGVETHF